MTLISAVIPTYKRVAQTRQAIRSALEQRGVELEVLVVDDVSPDDSFSLLKAEFASEPRVAFHQNPENSGAASGRNLGAARSRGEFVAFLDSDDVWYPDKCASQWAAWKSVKSRTEQPVLLYTSAKLEYEIAGSRINPSRPLLRGESIDHYIFLAEQEVQTSGWFMARSDFDKVKFTHKLRRHQDLDFILRARVAGFQFEMAAGPLYERTHWSDLAHVGQVKNDGITAAWLASIKSIMEPAAYHCFRQRHLLPALATADPAAAMRILAAAAWAGELKRSAIRQFVKAQLPERFKNG